MYVWGCDYVWGEVAWNLMNIPAWPLGLARKLLYVEDTLQELVGYRVLFLWSWQHQESVHSLWYLLIG